jgi:hypothetical protein
MTHTRLQLGGAFSTSTQTITLLPVISAFVGLYEDAEAAALRAHSWSGSVRNPTEAARAWAQCSYASMEEQMRLVMGSAPALVP